MCQSVNFRCWLLTLNWVKAHSQQWKKQSRQTSHRKRIRPLSPLRGSREMVRNQFSAFYALHIISHSGLPRSSKSATWICMFIKELFNISFLIKSKGIFARCIYTFVRYMPSKNNFIHLLIHLANTVTLFLRPDNVSKAGDALSHALKTQCQLGRWASR